MLTKQHPEIALSIKTRQAVRSVLNQLRDGVQELTMDGIIEETEGVKLEKVGSPITVNHKMTILACLYESTGRTIAQPLAWHGYWCG